MTRFRLAFVLLLAASAAIAADDVPAGDKLEKFVRDSIPVCPDLSIKRTPLDRKLPSNLTGSFVQVDSSRETCKGQYVSFVTSKGSFFLGYPWFLDEEEGTIEEKLAKFAWKRMQQTVTATVDRTRSRDGMFPATVFQITERGRLPLDGWVDPAGTVFVVGAFRDGSESPGAARLKALAGFLATAPATGAEKGEVTIIEFSDFECPSCRRAAGYVDPLLEKHAGKVRYVRYDLPLVQMHPWALSAAMAGRAIHRQKPELFWKFKKQIYENQDKLNAFTIDDFTRGFAEDNGLDMKKYEEDATSPALRDELLRAAGAALSNDVRATPTYMVNGTFVDPGPDGRLLHEYVEGLLKK